MQNANVQRNTGIRPRRHSVTLLRVLCPTLLAVVLVAIWALTVQTPEQTMALSGTWSALIARVTGLAPDTASWVARKVVHTVEFFPVGLFLALTIAVWIRGTALEQHRGKLIAGAVLVCFACSLGDQVHKVFVPGREFDALDMCFDAVGYLLGIWIVIAAERRLR